MYSRGPPPLLPDHPPPQCLGLLTDFVAAHQAVAGSSRLHCVCMMLGGWWLLRYGACTGACTTTHTSAHGFCEDGSDSCLAAQVYYKRGEVPDMRAFERRLQDIKCAVTLQAWLAFLSKHWCTSTL